jgi:Ca2+-binding RTX toxin-like protein
MARRWPRAFLVALVLAGLPASASAAGTVDVDVFGMNYTGDNGVNVITLTDAPVGMNVRVTVSEPGISAGAGCTDNGDTAFCDIGSTDSVDVSLGGGNDVATANGTLVRYRLDGEEGEDTLTGSDATEGAVFSAGDSLQGGPDRDTLIGRGGDDNLDGEDGDGDSVDGGAGDDAITFYEEAGSGDVLRGGPGFDILFAFYFGPDPTPGLSINLAAGTVTAVGATATLQSIEDANGDEGPDTIIGTAGPNLLDGDEGNDIIDGGAGPDRLTGDIGNDRLEGRDGFFDQLDGGVGTDTCDADQLDVRTACEAGALVQLPPFGSPAPPDRIAPTCNALDLPARTRVRGLLRRGLSVQVSCDEPGRLIARLLGTLRRLGRRPRAARPGDLELAWRSAAVVATEPLSLRLRVAKGLRRAVRRGVRLRVELTATDAAGNESVATRRVRLR